MNTFADIITKLGEDAVAKAIGQTPYAVAKMRQRESVRPKYWPALVGLARDKKVSGVTINKLARIAVQPRAAA